MNAKRCRVYHAVSDVSRSSNSGLQMMSGKKKAVDEWPGREQVNDDICMHQRALESVAKCWVDTSQDEYLLRAPEEWMSQTAAGTIHDL